MVANLKTSTGWRNLSSIKLKDSNGIWKNIAQAYLKIAGVWRIFFTSVTLPKIQTRASIYKTTSAIDGLITLTGTNYFWSDQSSGTLSLQYWFERSDGTLIGTKKTAVNPSSGSSTSYTQVVPSGSMLKNTDTEFQFVVQCTNTATTQVNTSVSLTTTFSGARNISNLATGTASYTSIPLTFTPGAYSLSYLVSYTYSGGSNFYSSAGTGSPSILITVPNLIANTSYTFTVTPYTGNIVNNFVTGYPGNASSSVTASTLVGISPTQTSAPAIPVGTGEYNTSITRGASGTYSSGTYTSVSRTLVAITASNPSPTNGSTSPEGIEIALTPHFVTQGSITSPYSNYYTRDNVLGIDGTTMYYYYSSPLRAYLATISDNFNRADGAIFSTNTGLNYSSVYSSSFSSWSVTSNLARSTSLVTSNSPVNPKLVIESGGKINITGSIQYPQTTSAGYGIAFWSTSAGSWWSVAPNSLTATGIACGTTYTTGLTSCPATGPNAGDYCGSCVSYIETIATCTGIADYPGTTTCPAGSCSCTNLAATSPTCSVSVTKALSCPATGTTAGSRCTDCSSVCDGAAIEQTTSQLDSFCGGTCTCTGPYSRTTYGCGTTVYGANGSCPTELVTTFNEANVGKRCTPCTRVDLATIQWKVVNRISSVYYNCQRSTCSYTAYSSGTAAGKTYGTAGSTDVTRYKSYKNVSQTTYNTYLQIYSSNGSSVTSKASQLIDAGATAYVDLYLVGVTTNNGVITAKAYSSALSQVGSDLTYTRQASDPVMSLTNGTSAHGMIKMYTLANDASFIDNLSIFLDS